MVMMIAQIWALLYRWFDMYAHDHMGGGLDVSISSNIVRMECKMWSRVFQSGLTNGGPAGLVYGFILVWIGTALQTLVMAELASLCVAACTRPLQLR